MSRHSTAMISDLRQQLEEACFDASVARGELDMAVAAARMQAIEEVCSFLEREGYNISAREARKQFHATRRAA